MVAKKDERLTEAVLLVTPVVALRSSVAALVQWKALMVAETCELGVVTAQWVAKSFSSRPDIEDSGCE